MDGFFPAPRKNVIRSAGTHRSNDVRHAGPRVASPGRADAGEELLEGLGGRWGAEPATQVERRITAGLVGGIEEQQARNDLRWTRFRFAALALAVALLLVVAEAVWMLFAW